MLSSIAVKKFANFVRRESLKYVFGEKYKNLKVLIEQNNIFNNRTLDNINTKNR